MKHVGRVLKQVYDSELDLADEYRKVGERHAVEHDVFHTAHTLAEQCRAHANAVQPFVERYGKRASEVDEEPSAWENLTAAIRRKQSEMLGRRESTGLLLLRDLKQLFLLAVECELNWVMAGQAAQVLHDRELLDTITLCSEQVGTQIRWLRTRVKEASPQVLAVG